MTNIYTLRVHSRSVVVDTLITKHTGYELIEYNENGTPIKVSTVDLYNDKGIVKFDIREQSVDLALFQATGIIHGNNVRFGNNSEYEVTEDWLMGNSYHTSPFFKISQEAVDIFNKIRLEAQVLNQFSNGILYDVMNRNCNSATQYFANNYLNGMNVFENLSGVYVGSGYDFTKNQSGANFVNNPYVLRASEIAEDVIACGAIDAFDNFMGFVPSGFNWNGFEITGYGSGFFMFSDGTNSYKVYEGFDSGQITHINGDDSGSNNIIGTSGRDRIIGWDYEDHLYGGKGDNISDFSLAV